MLRRLLPLSLIAGVCTLFYLTVFQTFSLRNLPQSVGLGDEYGDALHNGSLGWGEDEDEKADMKTGPSGILSGANQNDNFKVPEVDAKSPYPVGQTKPPGSLYVKTLVVPRLKSEDTRWVDNQLGDLIEQGLLKKAIYVVDDPHANFNTPDNKGHEVMAYLTYIIDFYDKLTDVSLFMHSHRFAWHNDELLDTDAALMIRHLSSERVTREGYMNLRCHWDRGCPEHIRPGTTHRDAAKQEEHILAEKWAELFPDDPIPQVLAQPCCGQFAVSRDRIRMLPRERYVHMRQWLLRTELSDYLSGRVFEYVWQYIFTASPLHCPSMSACYCDGFGICFGSPREFDHFFEVRYHRNAYTDELRIWQEKADSIALYKAMRADGRVTEEAELEVPEVGKDVELKRKIDDLNREMSEKVGRAFEAGRDPKQRAIEAGRDWHDGDGF